MLDCVNFLAKFKIVHYKKFNSMLCVFLQCLEYHPKNKIKNLKASESPILATLQEEV